jgi:hypothetical protein
MAVDALKNDGKQSPSVGPISKDNALSSAEPYPYTFGKQASAFTEFRESGQRLPFSGAQGATRSDDK